MNNVIEKENVKIENMIYEIRGVQVILDSDLARLYECTNGTKDINKSVKRNIDKFPEDFYFQLTIQEALSLSRFQNGTLKNARGYNIKYLPYVFTEQGVSMLATTLRTKIATQVSIKIMRTFVALRKYVSTSLIEQKYINNLVLKDSKRIDLIEETLSNFKEKNNHIFFEGQIYDAYSIMLDILNTSKTCIIIIDNYIDKNILDILSKTSKQIKLITNKYNNEDYDKYKKQYSNIDLIINNKIHDRFIIIDNKILYHCGASFKDLGKKCFAISKIDDDNVLNNLLKNL